MTRSESTSIIAGVFGMISTLNQLIFVLTNTSLMLTVSQIAFLTSNWELFDWNLLYLIFCKSDRSCTSNCTIRVPYWIAYKASRVSESCSPSINYEASWIIVSWGNFIWFEMQWLALSKVAFYLSRSLSSTNFDRSCMWTRLHIWSSKRISRIFI